MSAYTQVTPEVSASISFTQAVFILPGVDPKAFCQWASENFGVNVNVSHTGRNAFHVSGSGQDIWGALKDIHAHRDWVKTDEGKCALAHSLARAS